MGAMTPKGYDLAAQHSAIADGAILAVLDTMNGPVSDAYMENLMMNGKTKIITDLSQVIVGDMARAGIMNGVVTAIGNDGEVAPANNRIIVKFDTDDYILVFGTDPSNRIMSVDFVDNNDGVTDDKTYALNQQLLSTGIVFLRYT